MLKSIPGGKLTDKAQIPKANIAEALNRLLRSQHMAHAPRMRRLISYIVLETINGRTRSLKGYTIGVEVFDRDQSFDPDRDSIVRVQMGRLRTILDQYYLTQGKSDPIRISVAKGTYVPNFSRIRPATASGQSGLTALKAGHSTKHLLWLSALFLAGLLSLFIYHKFLSGTHAGGSASQQKPDQEEAIGRPVIAAFPFRNLSPGSGITYLTKGLAVELISNLSRFKQLDVLSQDITVFTEEPISNLPKFGHRLGAQYIVTGTIASMSDKLKILVHLQDTESGRVIWSNDTVWDARLSNELEIQADIARKVAGKLGQPYGVINRLQKSLLRQAGAKNQGAYQCVLQFYDYAREENQRNHLLSRQCLEQAVDASPGHAQAWAALSWIYADEFRQGFNLRTQERPPLDRALTAARKAVDLDPDDSFTRRRLANVYFIRGDVYLARDEVLKSLSLNPNNSEVMADVGWILKNAGEWDKAFDHASKAITLNPGHPPWYLETPFLYHYRNRDCRKAVQTAKKYLRQKSTILLPHVFLTISAILCPDQLDMTMHVKILNWSFPEFLKAPEAELKKLSVPEELTARILKDLRRAGVRLKNKS